jgi:hypothetical protein
MKTKSGFTLTEMLTALAVGMFVLNIAFASFFFTQKFVRKTEALGSKNDVLKSRILWLMTTRSDSKYPIGSQFRQIGVASMNYADGPDKGYAKVELTDYSAKPSPKIIAKVYVPLVGN